jgi:hypothetical protein
LAPDLLRQRLYNQHVAGRPLATPEEVVASLGAVQSQVFTNAKWAVGQRAKHCTDAAVQEAFDSGRILRTHVLRPTWHFVLAEDIRWMQRLTAPRVHAFSAYVNRQCELDGKIFARAHAVLEKALEGGKQLTRAELAAALHRSGIVAKTLRLACIVMHAELECVVCSGALGGKQHTYALLDERAPNALSFDRDEALAELTRRFFTSHAPATLKQYVWWSSLSVADAKAGLAMIRQDLERSVLDGTTWFGLAGRAPRRARPTAYFIPEYDEVLLGYRDLGVPDLPRTRRGQLPGGLSRTLFIDSTRAGTWTPSMAAARL